MFEGVSKAKGCFYVVSWGYHGDIMEISWGYDGALILQNLYYYTDLYPLEIKRTSSWEIAEQYGGL